MASSGQPAALRARIQQLERENAMLRRDFGSLGKGAMVRVPDDVAPLFEAAQHSVSDYFRDLKMDPTQGTIEIGEQRYVLVRASALSKDFLETVQRLYADRGAAEALSIGKNFLFDIAHVIGMNDARAFHQRMNFTDPLSKLSAGPIHFAYSGWAFVEILPDSTPTPDEDFYLHYHHPYSFEADSWLRADTRSAVPVCIMNAGYSSGWCEESFGIPLTSVEVSCRARGDAHCAFIMSPPHRIEGHLERFHQAHGGDFNPKTTYEIPTFFERKKVEEEMQRARQLAEESAQLKADFAANMSHELRTPLGAILGFTDLLKKTGLDATQRDYLQAIHTSGNNLLSIINDILDLSKLDAGKATLERLPFSIPELMHSVEVMFAARAAGKGLRFSCTTDPGIPGPLLGDPMRLTQILTNLIGNAVKFTEEGSVYVHCRLMEEGADRVTVRFTVEDTGIGVPPEKAVHIFERFTQGDTNITRKYGGTGLGLAITRQLVEMQGGSIALRAGDDRGAVFVVTLTYARAGADGGALPKQSSATHFHGASKRILVVEDNPLNQKLTAIILQNNGFEMALAGNGREGVEMARNQAFDAILMDIQMPVMDGYKATCAIRDELRIFTPIIAMTAHALEGEREACIHEGMNDYLSKPFREEELLQKLARWIRKDDRAEPPSPQRVTDLGFLREQSRNNSALIREMIRTFRAQTPHDLAGLEAAVTDAAYPVVHRTVHRLRNATGLFGVDKHIGPQLLRMEQLARAEEGLEELSALLQSVKPTFSRAVAELAAAETEELGRNDSDNSKK